MRGRVVYFQLTLHSAGVNAGFDDGRRHDPGQDAGLSCVHNNRRNRSCRSLSGRSRNGPGRHHRSCRYGRSCSMGHGRRRRSVRHHGSRRRRNSVCRRRRGFHSARKTGEAQVMRPRGGGRLHGDNCHGSSSHGSERCANCGVEQRQSQPVSLWLCRGRQRVAVGCYYFGILLEGRHSMCAGVVIRNLSLIKVKFKHRPTPQTIHRKGHYPVWRRIRFAPSVRALWLLKAGAETCNMAFGLRTKPEASTVWPERRENSAQAYREAGNQAADRDYFTGF
jgi:hypothetical protein